MDGPGHGGGLALLWKQKDSITIKSSSLNHIDAEFKIEVMDTWRLTGVGLPGENSTA